MYMSRQDESETVLNLVRSLTERNADCRALTMRFNHVKLQKESLAQQERALRESVARLEFENAIAEENIILLEVGLSLPPVSHPFSQLVAGEIADYIELRRCEHEQWAQRRV